MPEKLRDLYESEMERAVRLVPDTDPRTEEYSRLLYAIGELGYRLQSCIINAEYNTPHETAEEPKPSDVEEAHSTVVENAADTEYINPEDLRAALADAKKKGVNISELISSLGAPNFSGLRDDQDKLRHLKTLMEKALKEIA